MRRATIWEISSKLLPIAFISHIRRSDLNTLIGAVNWPPAHRSCGASGLSRFSEKGNRAEFVQFDSLPQPNDPSRWGGFAHRSGLREVQILTSTVKWPNFWGGVPDFLRIYLFLGVRTTSESIFSKVPHS